MPARILTAKNVLTLRPRAGRTRDIYFDRARGAPKGFALRVSHTARAFYLVYGRGASSRKSKVYLGDAESTSLTTARAKGHATRDLLQRGFDPKVEQERERRELRERDVAQAARPTLAALVDRFVAAHEKKYKRKTVREYQRIRRAYVVDHPLASLAASEVRRYQVRALLEGIAREAPVMANRVQQLIRAAYAWGIREQLDDDLEANPAAGFDVHDERPLAKEERTLSDDEVATLWTELDAVDAAGKRKVAPPAAAYVRLLLLCGLRRTEAALADWRDVNLTANEWRIPAANRKAAGRRGKVAEGRELIVPLSRAARAEFRVLHELTGPKGPAFGAVASIVRANPDRFIKRLRAAVGVAFSLHDLRATCATGVGECGARPHVVSLILGHAVLPGAAQATALYDRAMRLREVRTALERWAARVAKIAAGTSRADVVSIEAARS